MFGYSWFDGSGAFVVVDAVLGVVVEVALVVEIDVVIVVVIMVIDVVVMTLVEVLDATSSREVFGKLVKLEIVVVSLSGVLMITEGVVAVLEEDSAQRELWNFGYPLPLLAYGKIRTLLK